MKKNIVFIALFACFCSSIAAQKISFGMKTGNLFSKLKLDWSEKITNNGHTKIRPTYALFAEGQLYDFVYLGTELGTQSYSVFMDFKYDVSLDVLNSSRKTHFTYLGWYQQEQVYFALTSQLKFGKNHWISVGGGFAFYNNYINKFINGNEISYTDGLFNNSITDLTGKDFYRPNTTSGGFFNLTLNPKITKHLGILLETRYIINNPSNGQITKVKPDVSFNSFATIAGLSFHF